MNPVVTPVDDLVIYHLTEEDRKLAEEVKLVRGGSDAVDQAFHKMCIMQMITCLITPPENRPTTEDASEVRRLQQEIRKTSRAYSPKWGAWRKLRDRLDRKRFTDTPICVSAEITAAMQCLNDKRIGEAKRNMLKELAEEILNTCPVKRKELKTKVVERRVSTAEYREAERARRKMLAPIMANKVRFDQALELIRQAASIYKVGTTHASNK